MTTSSLLLNEIGTRLRNPIVLFDFWQMFCIWALHFRSEVIVTLSCVREGCTLFVLIISFCYWQNYTFAGIELHHPFSSHVASLLRFPFKMLLSIERVRYAMVSSVNRLNVPRLIPVELRICMMSDISPSMTTHCVLRERKPFVHAFVFHLIPYWSSLWIKSL